MDAVCFPHEPSNHDIFQWTWVVFQRSAPTQAIHWCVAPTLISTFWRLLYGWSLKTNRNISHYRCRIGSCFTVGFAQINQISDSVSRSLFAQGFKINLFQRTRTVNQRPIRHIPVGSTASFSNILEKSTSRRLDNPNQLRWAGSANRSTDWFSGRFQVGRNARAITARALTEFDREICSSSREFEIVYPDGFAVRVSHSTYIHVNLYYSFAAIDTTILTDERERHSEEFLAGSDRAGEFHLAAEGKFINFRTARPTQTHTHIYSHRRKVVLVFTRVNGYKRDWTVERMIIDRVLKVTGEQRDRMNGKRDEQLFRR